MSTEAVLCFETLVLIVVGCGWSVHKVVEADCGNEDATFVVVAHPDLSFVTYTECEC
jgi:hypothetical protein